MHSTPEPVRVCKKFIKTPQFLLWLLLFCGQAAFCVLALIPALGTGVGRFKELRSSHALTERTVVGLAVSALVLMAPGVLVAVPSLRPVLGLGSHLEKFPKDWPLAHHSLKVAPVIAFGLLVALVAIIGIWLVGVALQQLPKENPPVATDVERFVSLRNDLNMLLAIAAGIIGLATLATGALRNAVLALNPVKPAFEFDAQYVLVYGLFFTGLLAIAFAPSYLALRAAGARVRDSAYPLPAPGDPKFMETVRDRSSLDQFLQVNLSASATFKAAVAILTPLTTSLIALLVPT